jgi:hypothetical protein
MRTQLAQSMLNAGKCPINFNLSRRALPQKSGFGMIYEANDIFASKSILTE